MIIYRRRLKRLFFVFQNFATFDLSEKTNSNRNVLVVCVSITEHSFESKRVQIEYTYRRGLSALLVFGKGQCEGLKYETGKVREPTLFYYTTKRIYMIHIGKHIEKVVHEQGRSVTWFANQLCYNRSNVYKIFEKNSIDIILLWKISKILNHDFFADISFHLKEDKEDQ